MLHLLDYDLDDLLAESRESLVYHGQRGSDGLPVILKVLRDEYPSPERIAWFTREYALTRSLQGAGAVQAYSLETDGQHQLMVLEDFGGTSLVQLGLAGKLDLCTFLTLSIQIAQALGQVHAQRVVHRDLNPSNIVCNPATSQVKLIDFGIATVLPREQPSLRTPERLEGTLAYISPEQTGRMNRAMDYRTDYYSLGATLYELLAGRPPFSAPDALALVHAHLAKAPIPPDQLRPGLPTVVGAIVLKLLAKNAEDRYQSTAGLIADLEECLHQARSTGSIEEFPLGRQDRPAQLQVSQRLYGREEAGAQLLQALDAASMGTSGLVLVAGEAGIGKTALVQELYRPLTRRRGYLVAGKFDQLRSDLPYAGVLQAMRALLQLVLTEDEAPLTQWREQLTTALGSNGQVISALLPDLELLLGPQPPVQTLGGKEAQQRLQQVFSQFLGVFGQAGHPLVLFLDDLQWADLASLALLQALLTAPECTHVLVICAYRDSEIGPLHGLQRLCDALDESHVQRLTLCPLQVPHIQSLLADTLHCPAEQTAPLADLLFAQTEGNPFFLNEFLKSLYADDLLAFDPAQGCWQWDVEHIRATRISDTVVDLLAEQVRQLPPATQHALSLAACVGHRFALSVLSQLEQQAPEVTAHALWPALEAGLILPLDESYKVMEVAGHAVPTVAQLEFRFAHDQIQLALYAVIAEAERPAIHLQIGAVLQSHTPQMERESRIFDVVHHLNLGRSLLTKQTERDELAFLNLRAGQHARAATAFELAFAYHCAGLALLGKDCWQQQYALTLELHVAAAETGFVGGHLDAVEALSRTAIEHAQSVLDKVPSYDLLLQLLLATNKPHDAVTSGLEILRLLGMRVPAQPRTTHIVKELLATRFALAGKRVESLLNLPEMTDPYKLAAMRILVVVASASFSGAPLLMPILVCKMVILSVQSGNAPRSAAGYSGYGGLLCAGAGSIESGYRFGKLAAQLSEQRPDNALHSQTQLSLNALIWHWKEPLRTSLAPLLDAYRAGIAAGDVGFACMHLGLYALHAYFSGRTLPEFEREVDGHCREMVQRGQGALADFYQVYVQAARNLQQEVADPCSLSGSVYNSEQLLPLLREANDGGKLATHALIRLTLCYLFHDYTTALEQCNALADHVGSVRGTIMVPAWIFYRALTLLALYPTASPAVQRGYRKQVDTALRKLHGWAGHAPSNYLHKMHLVEAERARTLDQPAQAHHHYQQAIRLAHKEGYRNEEGMAQELAGSFYLGNGQAELARFYLRQAHVTYSSWGAQGKVADLAKRYPDVLALTGAVIPHSDTSTTHVSTTTSSMIFDLSSVLQAAQAISSEIALDRLLAKLLHLVLINAGAQRGVLLLDQAGDLRVAAESDSEHTAVVHRPLLELAGNSNLATAIVRYVARTKEQLTYPETSHREFFAGDPYLAERAPRSILCLPLLNQTKLIGLLYLENQLTADAFTPDRLEVLQLLSSQAAVSLENAMLYERLETYNRTLEQTVAQRTEELHSAMAQLERIATTDELTGVHNRRHFFALGEVERHKAHRHGQPLTAMMLDIDHFKQVNDERGHGVGDQVLHVVAQRLQSCIRQGDILGRYGGEEFALLLPHTSAQGALILAERLRQAVADEPITTSSGPVLSTISVGVAGTLEDLPDLSALLGHADQALYSAKRAGRNCVVVDRLPAGESYNEVVPPASSRRPA